MSRSYYENKKDQAFNTLKQLELKKQQLNRLYPNFVNGVDYEFEEDSLEADEHRKYFTHLSYIENQREIALEQFEKYHDLLENTPNDDDDNPVYDNNALVKYADDDAADPVDFYDDPVQFNDPFHDNLSFNINSPANKALALLIGGSLLYGGYKLLKNKNKKRSVKNKGIHK